MEKGIKKLNKMTMKEVWQYYNKSFKKELKLRYNLKMKNKSKTSWISGKTIFWQLKRKWHENIKGLHGP